MALQGNLGNQIVPRHITIQTSTNKVRKNNIKPNSAGAGSYFEIDLNQWLLSQLVLLGVLNNACCEPTSLNVGAAGGFTYDVTSQYTIVTTANATAANNLVLLPIAALGIGTIQVKNASANSVTIGVQNATDYLQGSANGTYVLIAGDVATLIVSQTNPGKWEVYSDVVSAI